MKSIGQIIKNFLSSWIECEYCNHMVREDRIVSPEWYEVLSAGYIAPICDECNDEHKVWLNKGDINARIYD